MEGSEKTRGRYTDYFVVFGDSLLVVWTQKLCGQRSGYLVICRNFVARRLQVRNFCTFVVKKVRLLLTEDLDKNQENCTFSKHEFLGTQ